MWKNNAAASQRIASNEFIYIYVFIYINLYIYIFYIFCAWHLSWCGEEFRHRHVKAALRAKTSLADATPKSITVLYSVCTFFCLYVWVCASKNKWILQQFAQLNPIDSGLKVYLIFPAKIENLNWYLTWPYNCSSLNILFCTPFPLSASPFS